MTRPNSRTTRLLEFITALYPWPHGHQKKGLAKFVGALLETKSCTQAKLASAFEKKKAAIKQLSRLLHNERLRTDELAEGVATEIVAHLARRVCVRIALDWTIEDGKHLLVASVIVGRRAVPPYWRAHPARSATGARSRPWLAPV